MIAASFFTLSRTHALYIIMCGVAKACFPLLTGLIFSASLTAQTYTAGREFYTTWEDFVEQYYNAAEEEDDNQKERADHLLQLQELYEHPLNINTAGRDALLEIPFLTDQQADSLLSYRARKHLFRSLGELQFISPLNREMRQWLSLFTYAGDTLAPRRSAADALWGGRHELTVHLSVPCYRRDGNRPHSDEVLQKYPNRQYLGNGLSNTIRYRYRSLRDGIAYGLTLQKDAGEPFACRGNYPYDYTSAYFSLAPPNRRWALWLGDYELNVAQGLLAGTRHYDSRLMLGAGLVRQPAPIRPHTSAAESDFMRGGAVRLRLGSWQLTAFAAWQRIDGTLRGDTLTALKTDGMHRTLGEMERRRTAGRLTAGAGADYIAHTWHAGLTFMADRYDKTIFPPLRTDNRYTLRGRNAAGASAHYAWQATRRFSAAGEVAADRLGHFATLHTMRFSPLPTLDLSLQMRHLSPRYVAPHAKALVRNSRQQNETGLTLLANWRTAERFTTTAYADLFRFPQPTYKASQPGSKGMELFLQETYTPTRHTTLALRYKLQTRQEDIKNFDGMLQYATTHRLRLSYSAATQPHLSLHTAVDAAFTQSQTASTQCGYMLSARTSYTARRFSASAFAAIFFTDDYATRLYAYQPQLPGTGSFPSFAYHGYSLVIQAIIKITPRLRLALRDNLLHYFNKKTIGSGAQRIDSPTKNDLSAQIKWSF